VKPNNQLLVIEMKKAVASLATFLSASALTATAAAQTPDNSNSASTLAGEAIAIVVIVVIFAIIVYAGYKVIKKWSSGQSD
jgi:hypothetical protein